LLDSAVIDVEAIELMLTISSLSFQSTHCAKPSAHEERRCNSARKQE